MELELLGLVRPLPGGRVRRVRLGELLDAS
jgi:hypothetical protein